jgi:hypothetical protein
MNASGFALALAVRDGLFSATLIVNAQQEYAKERPIDADSR